MFAGKATLSAAALLFGAKATGNPVATALLVAVAGWIGHQVDQELAAYLCPSCQRQLTY